MKSGKGDEICVCWPTRGRVGDSQDGVSDLLDVDRLREAGLLRIVALKVDTGRDVRDAVGSRRRMVASNTLALSSKEVGCGWLRLLIPNLFTDQLSGAGLILPLSKKQLSQKGIEGLFLVSVLLATAGILLLEGSQEPLQYKQGAFLGVGLLCRSCENGGMFAPIRRELGQAGRREDKRRCCKAGKIAVE